MIVESNHEGVSVIRIVTDSTASIPEYVADQHDIDVVSLHLHWKGMEYEDSSMDVDSFYEDIYEMITDIPTSSHELEHVRHDELRTQRCAKRCVKIQELQFQNHRCYVEQLRRGISRARRCRRARCWVLAR